MSELKLQILPKVSLIAFILGLVIIIFSPKLGRETTNAFLSDGGIMSPESFSVQFSAMLQGSINSYFIIGAVLLFLGGLGCLMSITFFEMNKNNRI